MSIEYPEWEDPSIIRIVPQTSTFVRGINDFKDHPGEVKISSKGNITWVVKFRNGMIKRFTFRCNKQTDE